MAGLLQATFSFPVQAACPIELAVYGEKNQAAEIDFRPATDAATVTNSFQMVIGNFVLDGFVQWTEGESRPYGTLHYSCPTGDVTGEEYAACTVWQGVIYTANEQGVIDLLPAPGAPAPKRLILADLGPSLKAATAFGPTGLTKIPFDVFEMKGCQE